MIIASTPLVWFCDIASLICELKSVTWENCDNAQAMESIWTIFYDENGRCNPPNPLIFFKASASKSKVGCTAISKVWTIGMLVAAKGPPGKCAGAATSNVILHPARTGNTELRTTLQTNTIIFWHSSERKNNHEINIKIKAQNWKHWRNENVNSTLLVCFSSVQSFGHHQLFFIEIKRFFFNPPAQKNKNI